MQPDYVNHRHNGFGVANASEVFPTTLSEFAKGLHRAFYGTDIAGANYRNIDQARYALRVFRHLLEENRFCNIAPSGDHNMHPHVDGGPDGIFDQITRMESE